MDSKDEEMVAAGERSKAEDELLKERVVSYLSFEQLQQLNDDHVLLVLSPQNYFQQEMKQIIGDPELWYEQFHMLDIFRRANKYHFSQFMNLLNQVPETYLFIKNMVENLRSNLSKNSLMLTSELFDQNGQLNQFLNNQSETKFVVEALKQIMPSLLARTTYDKVFIAKEAKQALQNSLTTCCALPGTLECLLNEGLPVKVTNKNLLELVYTQFLPHYIEAISKQGKDQITSLFIVTQTIDNDSQWTQEALLFGKKILEGIEGFPRIKKASTEVLQKLGKVFEANLEKESLKQLLTKVLSKDLEMRRLEKEENKWDEETQQKAIEVQLQKYLSLCEQKKTEAKPVAKKDFRQFLKQQKTEGADQ